MTEIPAERPVERRVNDGAADMGTLIDMNLADEQPQPPDAVPEE
ncbi:hypothetical protein [Streptomyces sp. NPDC059165]